MLLTLNVLVAELNLFRAKLLNCTTNGVYISFSKLRICNSGHLDYEPPQGNKYRHKLYIKSTRYMRWWTLCMLGPAELHDSSNAMVRAVLLNYRKAFDLIDHHIYPA